MPRPESDPKAGLLDAPPFRQAMGDEVWEISPVIVTGPIAYRSQSRTATSAAVARLAESALQTPIDFPPLGDAILPGDHVAVAVDPTIPQVADVLAGVVAAIHRGGVMRVSVVFWEEASDATIEQTRTRIGQLALPLEVTVSRHQSGSRPDLRYVAADDDAEPIYLARELVDADFTLPLIAARWTDGVKGLDPSAIFPMFADAATQSRYQSGPPLSSTRVGWLLGVQLMLMVSSDGHGMIASLLAGTPESLRQELLSVHHRGDFESNPSAGLIVAAIDGDASAHSWENVARAALAALPYVDPGGAIVVWSRLNAPPPPLWQAILIDSDEPEDESLETDEATDDASTSLTESGATKGSGQRHLAEAFAHLTHQHRVWLFSDVEPESVEELGLGVIHDVAELTKLAAALGSAGVLRAAQFQSQSVPRRGDAL